MASNVPRFASFRPKAKAAPAPEPLQEPSKSGSTKKHILENEPQSLRRNSPSPKRSRPAQEVTSTKTYFSDRRGDPDILRYGGPNQHDIPAYRRYGYGYVLGLPPDRKIDREHSTEKKIPITPIMPKRQDRLLVSKHANKSNHRATRLVKVSDFDADIDLELDFVALSRATKNTQQDGDGDSDDEVTPETDYRGLHEKDTFRPADRDTQYEPEDETSIDPEVTRKNSELVKKTRGDPENLQAWLAFIQHQEAMLTLDRPSNELNTSDRGHLADIRIAIYEEALKKIGDNQNSQIELYQGLLKEAHRAIPGSRNSLKVSRLWNDVLAKYPCSVDIWFMYLDFVQSSFTSFKYEDCRSKFLNCLEALKGLGSDIIMYVLLRLTTMMHESGYQELAIAIWQAVIEVHVVSTKDQQGQRIEAFEAFWESEGPRVGEEGAEGWRHPNTNNETPSDSSPLLLPDPSNSVFQGFKRREVDATKKLRYPGRTSDELGEDDAFHTIFVSDLIDYVKAVPAATPAVMLLDAFLCFCGLPPIPVHGSHQAKWWSDPFLRRQTPSSHYLLDEVNRFRKTLHHISLCPIRKLQMTTELLFEQNFLLDATRLSPDFVRRILTLSATNVPEEEAFGEYLLAFEFPHFAASAHKTAKRLLKVSPSSLRLYNAYGLLESRRGNFIKADQVFSMALSMQKEGLILSIPGSLDLAHSWVWQAMDRGETLEAFWRLVSLQSRARDRMETIKQPNQDMVLRARNALTESIEHALLHQNYQSAITSTSLLAILTYFSNKSNVELALTTLQNLTAWFGSHKLSSSPVAELHAQAIARFLTYHVTHTSIVKPGLLRTTLEPLISRFPDNTILLSLYAANEARFSIDDRVRSIMHQTALQRSGDTSIFGWAFAIHYETVRGEIAGSTSHSIRALYKRATDGTGACSAALWTTYVRFELYQLRQEEARRPDPKLREDGKEGTREIRVNAAAQRVKDTFYAGLRKLPWCKEFFMLAFMDAEEVFGDEEKWRLYRVMQEKELRVYVELDDIET